MSESVEKAALLDVVARALCWASTDDYGDCMNACLRAGKCMAERPNECFYRDAQAALSAIPAEGDVVATLLTDGGTKIVTLDPSKHGPNWLTGWAQEPLVRQSALTAAHARIAELEARGDALAGALRKARQVIADIDDYMKRPGRGDWGEECACCMGEMLDDDREAIASIDATLSQHGSRADD